MTNSNELREQKERQRGIKKEGAREIRYRSSFIQKHDRGLNLKRKREREIESERKIDK